jgi:hypothetical protein
MHNLPKVYGGEVRKHKKVTGIGSGFAQGGKVLFCHNQPEEHWLKWGKGVCIGAL